MFNKEMNLVKALAIMVIVSGHLEFALLGTIFPPYSFHLAIFFFVAGYFYKSKNEQNILAFIGKKAKTLLVPYFIYNAFYAVITVIVFKLYGQVVGQLPTLKNFIFTPFFNGCQYMLYGAAWFVPQLFMSLCAFGILMILLKKITLNKYVQLTFFLALAILSISLSKVWDVSLGLIAVRTMFSLFFIYLGYFYKHFLEENFAEKIFNIKWLPLVFAFQSLFWLTNKDVTAQDGIGLSYILIWGMFDDNFIPLLTSLTGIWFTIFIAKLIKDKVQDGSFLDLVGKNTFHIMANHLLVFYCLSVILLKSHNLPLEPMSGYSYVYYIFEPLKYTFLYFTSAMFITTYSAVWISGLKNKLSQVR